MKTSQELSQDNRCNGVCKQPGVDKVSKIVSPNENHVLAVHEGSTAQELSKDAHSMLGHDEAE